MGKTSIDLVEGNGMHIWDKQPTEYDSAYSYFMRYLFMTNYMDQRDIGELARMLDLSHHTLYGYSKQFRWRERAEAHDKHFADKRRIDREAIRSRAEDILMTKGMRLLDRFLAFVDAAEDKAVGQAEVFAASFAEEEGHDLDKLSVSVKMDTSFWKDVANTYATLAKEVRIGVGLPTNITESKGTLEHKHSFEDVLKQLKGSSQQDE